MSIATSDPSRFYPAACDYLHTRLGNDYQPKAPLLKVMPRSLRLPFFVGMSPRGVFERLFSVPVTGGAITLSVFETMESRLINSPSPLIFYIKDSHWRDGDLAFNTRFCQILAHTTQSIVVMPRFRSSPLHKFPLPLHDCAEALVWIFSGAKFWKVHPQKVLLLGIGAGGGMAPGVAALAKKENVQVSGQILVSPLCDARLKTRSIENISREDEKVQLEEFQSAVNDYAGQPKDVFDPLFSPLLSIGSIGCPQTLVLWGENDILKSDALLMVSKLKSDGVKVNAFEIPRCQSGFLFLRHSPYNVASLSLIRAFAEGRSLDNAAIA